MKKNRTLQELFSFPGFKACQQLEGKFGDPKARIIILNRQKKQQNVQDAIRFIKRFTIERLANRATEMLEIIELFFVTRGGVYFAKNVMVFAWSS